MNQYLKNISRRIFGITIFFGLIFIGLFILKGNLWFNKRIFPWTFLIFFITLILDSFILLPISITRKNRKIGFAGLLVSSYLIGLLLWSWSFLFVYSIWGWTAIIIGLIIAGIGVVPIAIIALIFNSQWLVLLQLVILIIITFGIRFAVSYFAKKSDSNYNVIDFGISNTML